MSDDPFAAFEVWRIAARENLRNGIAPHYAAWDDKGGSQHGLFGVDASLRVSTFKGQVSITREFLTFTKTISCHSDPERWNLLYAVLWRLAAGEKYILTLATDPLIRRLRLMEKAVRRDAHKAKAFVRFRAVQEEGEEYFIAWHRPDHDILPLVGPFFQRRFQIMRWSILTPQRSLHWDGEALSYADGVPESHAAAPDAMEDMWRTYYRAIFNPARIKLKMMRQEMPVRYWATMPETQIIADLLSEAPARVQAMIAHQEGIASSATDFLPAARDLESLSQAALRCQGCPLYRGATCTVFGTGPAHAKLMIVGEQPGDQEDKTGQPFVGPAGEMLNRALADAGLDRSSIYLTNTVKHFKFKMKGTHRSHVTPGIREINACRPWLEAEIEAIRPKVILALGVTAGRGLLGPGFTLKSARGAWHDGPQNARLRVSWHPAAILRATDMAQQGNFYKDLVEDLSFINAYI